MKVLKYNMTAHDADGNEIMGAEKIMSYSEANETLARAEAWQGSVEIFDNEWPEPESYEVLVDTLLGVK